MQYLFAMLGAAGVALLVDIAFSLRAIRNLSEHLQRQRSFPFWFHSSRGALYWHSSRGHFPHARHFSSAIVACPEGITTWVFRKGAWLLEETTCAEGYEPGPPPAGPGEFDGYRKRTVCIKRRAR
jgi:hypothetical protein